MAKPNLSEKDALNPQEAIAYWELSARRFYRFLKKTDGGNFLAYYKTRKLILRVAFEQHLKENPKLWEELKNGEIG